MGRRTVLAAVLSLAMAGGALEVQGAQITAQDSTQPRGAIDDADLNHDGVLDLADFFILKANFLKTGVGIPGDINGDGVVNLNDYVILKRKMLPNDQGQSLAPITDGFRAPARFDTPEGFYRDWAGNIMANAIRDPGFFATLSVANQDLITFINSLPGQPNQPRSPLGRFLRANKLEKDIYRAADGSLQPEDKLPVAADICLRCHSPVGWLEAHSEPPTAAFSFLNGQFWGAAFLEEPGHAGFDITVESEAEMEGVQCDFCHRAKDNYKRVSRYDGSIIPAGNGGFFVETENVFGDLDTLPSPEGNAAFQNSANLCGSCHDVTNPFIKTQTVVDGAIPDMLHPIERTFTEWYWSDFRQTTPCQHCHEPMQFKGAQTWLLYPGLDLLWGDLDQKWLDRGLPLATSKTAALMQAEQANRQLMRDAAAAVTMTPAALVASPGEQVSVTVRVENLTGHKLPTGYIEGRQMWIHIRATDEGGAVIFEDGVLDASGQLQRTPGVTKVYEQVTDAEGYSFLPPDQKKFRFVLMNTIKKDNRIPPRGYNKAAYQADGAFIIPENLYADGQNWDETAYSFTLPANVSGKVRVTATLYYQTFNREYVDFLKTHDQEPTQAHGGRARNLPAGGNYAAGHTTWGSALEALWTDVGQGPPVEMRSASAEIEIQ
ncbi:MAG: hypothetical protein AB1634_14620 [Thermodesulfobacteriota bacterium]